MKLKPCPFCGSESSQTVINNRVECWDCGAQGPLAVGPSETAEKVAIKRWNERSGE